MVSLLNLSGAGGQNKRKKSESTLKCCYLGLEKKNAVSHIKHVACTWPWRAGAKLRGSLKGMVQPQGKMNPLTAPQL